MGITSLAVGGTESVVVVAAGAHVEAGTPSEDDDDAEDTSVVAGDVTRLAVTSTEDDVVSAGVEARTPSGDEEDTSVVAGGDATKLTVLVAEEDVVLEVGTTTAGIPLVDAEGGVAAVDVATAVVE